MSDFAGSVDKIVLPYRTFTDLDNLTTLFAIVGDSSGSARFSSFIKENVTSYTITSAYAPSASGSFVVQAIRTINRTANANFFLFGHAVTTTSSGNLFNDGSGVGTASDRNFFFGDSDSPTDVNAGGIYVPGTAGVYFDFVTGGLTIPASQYPLAYGGGIAAANTMIWVFGREY